MLSLLNLIEWIIDIMICCEKICAYACQKGEKT